MHDVSRSIGRVLYRIHKLAASSGGTADVRRRSLSLPFGDRSAAAYCLSSNYNFPPGLGSGFDAIQAAMANVHTDGAKFSELEKDLIEALAVRSSQETRDAVDMATMFLGTITRARRMVATA